MFPTHANNQNREAPNVSRSPSWAVVLFALAFVLLGIIAVCAAGCAVGRTSDGTTVAGFPIGNAAPETLGEVASAAAAFLPPPFNVVAALAGTVLAGIGGHKLATAAARRADAAYDDGTAAANAARDRADAAYDEASIRAASVRPAVQQFAPTDAPGGANDA